MRGHCCSAAFWILVATALPAQVAPGNPVPPLPISWPFGAAIEADGAAAPKVLVLAFHADLGSACSDADVLRRLQRDTVKAAVIVPDATGPLPDALAGLAVGVDGDRAVASAWLGEEPDFHVVVISGGAVAWVGRPEQGLGAAVGDLLAGKLDAAEQAQQLLLRQTLIGAFDDLAGADARAQAEALLHQCPTDGVAWGLLYLAVADKLVDAKGGAEVVTRATAALHDEPRALAAAADLMLRGDPRNKPLGVELSLPLTTGATAMPDDLRVQLALLRSLARAGKGRDVGRLAQQLAKKVDRHGTAALEFLDILANDEPAMVHKDLAQQALAHAERLGVPDRLLAAARYTFLLRCADDKPAASKVADDYMEGLGARVSLNNQAWYLMTELPTRGRFDVFALALVERMLQQKEAMDYFEFDTCALAMFLAGRFEDAVELQQAAIDKGGKGNREYVERLQRYRAALPSAPR